MLLAIDFSNLLSRHFANSYNQDLNAAGQDVSGVSGALRQIAANLRNVSASQLLIAGDDSRSNLHRRQIDQQYKAERQPAPPELQQQRIIAAEVLQNCQLPILVHPGHEADDLLASAATQYAGPAVVVSGDKDLLALCSSRITVRLLRRGTVLDCQQQQCLQLIGVEPGQVTDYKALAGDRGDGISGLPGIGPKKAIALLQKYGSLDNLLAADFPLADFPKKISETIDSNRQLAERCRQLAALRTDLSQVSTHQVQADQAAERLELAVQQLVVSR